MAENYFYISKFLIIFNLKDLARTDIMEMQCIITGMRYRLFNYLLVYAVTMGMSGKTNYTWRIIGSFLLSV